MKRSLYVIQVVLFISFVFFFYLSLAEVFRFSTPLSRFNHDIPQYDGVEAYDASLIRLNTMKKLEDYCDSIYTSQYQKLNLEDSDFSARYATIVGAVGRDKFFHGYSSYGFSNNYMALLIEPVSNKWLSAIVLPDDIVKFPFAACSQQSIVMMKLFAAKGIPTRKVIFDGGEKYGGHFCFEAHYNNAWHFFDPDKEPDAGLLNALGRPDIKTLAANDSILVTAYSHLSSDNAIGLYKNYFYGQLNVAEAPRASIYQKVTKVLSYTFWILPLAFLLWIRKRNVYKPAK
jgi:hypothetical protein